MEHQIRRLQEKKKVDCRNYSWQSKI